MSGTILRLVAVGAAFAILAGCLALDGGAASRQTAGSVAHMTPSRAAEHTYFDGVGDSYVQGGDDLDYVAVTDVAGGYIGMGLTYASRRCLLYGESLDFFIDADESTATGYGWGIDAQLTLSPPNNVTLRKWNGSTMVAASTSATLSCKGNYDFVFFNRSDLGIGTGFNFMVTILAGNQISDRISTPWNYKLTLPTPPPPPPEPEPKPETRSWRDAPGLPSRIRYTGASIKHVRLGENLYKTLKRLGSPRVVAVACWSKADWPGVLESSTGGSDDPDSVTVAFWLPRQPRWLHISPKQCADVQGLMTDRRLNEQRAYALATVLHERVHADGYRNESQTNCYAVQLVYSFARTLGFADPKAAELERLAVRKARAVAPRGYWDPTRCRDGGQWDLLSETRNLAS